MNYSMFTCADFDEQCSKEDDWDVDTSVYYSRGEGASRDAVALRDMAQERRLREGEDRDSETWRTAAGFEKHTKVSLPVLCSLTCI